MTPPIIRVHLRTPLLHEGDGGCHPLFELFFDGGLNGRTSEHCNPCIVLVLSVLALQLIRQDLIRQLGIHPTAALLHDLTDKEALKFRLTGTILL